MLSNKQVHQFIIETYNKDFAAKMEARERQKRTRKWQKRASKVSCRQKWEKMTKSTEQGGGVIFRFSKGR